MSSERRRSHFAELFPEPQLQLLRLRPFSVASEVARNQTKTKIPASICAKVFVEHERGHSIRAAGIKSRKMTSAMSANVIVKWLPLLYAKRVLHHKVRAFIGSKGSERTQKRSCTETFESSEFKDKNWSRLLVGEYASSLGLFELGLI